MDAEMPCKEEQRNFPVGCALQDEDTHTLKRKLRETVAGENTNPRKTTKYACIVEAKESKRKRLESTIPRDNEDHIAENGFNSINHYNLVHKLILMPQAMNIPDAKAAVNREWEKLEHIPAWQMEKRKRKSLSYIDGHMSS